MREELEAEYSSEPIAIGFNPKYAVELLIELLVQMSSAQVTVPSAATSNRDCYGR